jgi:hypothetical protein
MPKSKAAPREMIPQYVLREDAELAEIASRIPRRRASRTLIRAYCRTCQPGDRSDCEATDRVISGMRFPQCPLYPYRPWPGPGHAPRHQRTAKQRAAAADGLAAAARKTRKPLTEGQYIARTGADD